MPWPLHVFLGTSKDLSSIQFHSTRLFTLMGAYMPLALFSNMMLNGSAVVSALSLATQVSDRSPPLGGKPVRQGQPKLHLFCLPSHPALQEDWLPTQNPAVLDISASALTALSCSTPGSDLQHWVGRGVNPVDGGSVPTHTHTPCPSVSAQRHNTADSDSLAFPLYGLVHTPVERAHFSAWFTSRAYGDKACKR